ncbi:hypothetical protein BKA70DRAFT_1408475 [Coprinopsis sp. MPI-PUGE-AT-0042]|nr:hypothetical protein BKA70DRAFT_1408475 [Coprinopsis sp. MPI-PUGE-AT-0042]
MSKPSKITSDRNQRVLVELCTRPGNDICADCKARNPRWASWNLGIFICVTCASIHRKIGTHITKVKSVTMDTWTNEQVDSMKNMGNVKSNDIFNPNEVRHPPPPDLDDSSRDSELEKYIRGKYEYRKFCDKSAFVASKLGPSKSTLNATPRSVSSPLTQPNRASTLATTTPSLSTPKAPTPSPLSQSSQPSTSRGSQARSFSQPMAAAEVQKAQGGGVWDDLVQLQDTKPAPTLPLQYQQTSVGPPNGLPSSMSMTLPLGATPTGYSMNQFQQQQQQPFQQQQPMSAYGLSGQFTPSMQMTPNFQQSQQSYGNQLFQSTLQTPNGMSSAIFQPQPQTAAGLQAQQQGQHPGFLTPSPSMMSAPVTQTHFLTPSPSQQMQQQQQMNGGYHQMSPSPQLQMGYGGQGLSHSPVPMSMGGQFGGGMMQQQPQSAAVMGSFQQQPQQTGMMMSPEQFQAGMMMNSGQGGGFGGGPFHQQQQQWGGF